MLCCTFPVVLEVGNVVLNSWGPKQCSQRCTNTPCDITKGNFPQIVKARIFWKEGQEEEIKGEIFPHVCKAADGPDC